MDFIDKSKGKNWAHPILKAFLARCASRTPYPADLYDAMKSDIEPDHDLNPTQESTYRRLLSGILCESAGREGNPHCCYCMRTLSVSGGHSTLEHVIPNKVPDQNAYNSYFNVPSLLESDRHVMVFRDVFQNRHKGIAPPFPHTIAYENLVASCDGSIPKGSTQHICCNNCRGDQYIPPFMFMRNISQEFVYKSQTGRVIWKGNSFINKRECMRVVTDVLNLNCNCLRIIRMIWFHLAGKGLDCNLSKDEKTRVIDTISAQCNEMDRDVLWNFKNDNYWSLLSEYKYFNDIKKFSA